MINIAIFDPNEVFRESLKIMLEQIDGFRVVLETNDCNSFKALVNTPVEVLLIDNGFGTDKQNELMAGAQKLGVKTQSLILAMYKEDLNLSSGNTDLILKNSGKKEFERRIKKLVDL